MNLAPCTRRRIGTFVASLLLASLPCVPSFAQVQQQSKPNILFIMGDDIGWMQPGCYHRGLMVGETPNIDRIANENLETAEMYQDAEMQWGAWGGWGMGWGPMGMGVGVGRFR